MTAQAFMHGSSRYWNGDKSIADLPWNNHPTFQGVAMKHLVTGDETGGQISLHLVRIAPHCAIGQHQHASQWELHQVLEGGGETILQGKVIAYLPGTVGTMPMGEPHEVRAGKAGLILLATFSPPLL